MKKYFIKIKLYSCLALIIVATLTPLKVLALSNDAFYNSNDILFYDSTDTGCTGNTSTGTVTLVKSDSLQLIFQLLINGGMSATQASAVMGNMYAESGFDSNQTESNGVGPGYGLAQWTGGRRTQLESYASLHGKPASDVATQISFLLNEYTTTYKSRLDATAFKDSTNIAASTEAWMNIFEAPLMMPTNDPAALNSKRIPAAITIYGFYSNLSQNYTVVLDGCNNSTNGVIAGNIVATALGLALKTPAADGMTALSDATEAYRTVKAQYNPSVDVTDCGGFVATVMISSGVDPNYPNVGVSTQYAYLVSHPEKYQIITKPTASNLQPGDILISTQAQHTMIHTGNVDYTDVDASLNQRVPSVRNSSSYIWMLNNGAVIARIIK